MGFSGPGPGRTSKGDRDSFYVRPQRDVGNVIRARAEELGMDFGPYCSMILAQAHGLPDLADQPPAPSGQLDLLKIRKTA